MTSVPLLSSSANVYFVSVPPKSTTVSTCIHQTSLSQVGYFVPSRQFLVLPLFCSEPVLLFFCCSYINSCIWYTCLWRCSCQLMAWQNSYNMQLIIHELLHKVPMLYSYIGTSGSGGGGGSGGSNPPLEK